MTIIYDFGANNGDDIPYYLLRADLVVAVEANPALCNVITKRFAAEIASKRLAVLNKVLVDQEGVKQSPFFIHKTHSVLSQLPEPVAAAKSSYKEVIIECETPTSIIKRYGVPLYVKSDVEYFDDRILRNIFASGIFPPFLSAEAHDINVFATLVCLGNYKAFKYVEGGTVDSVYRNKLLAVDGIPMRYSFPRHSAGPFGDDIDMPWMTATTFHEVLAVRGCAWIDIHASNAVDASPASGRVRWLRNVQRVIRVSQRASAALRFT